MSEFVTNPNNQDSNINVPVPSSESKKYRISIMDLSHIRLSFYQRVVRKVKCY
jgi:hypothetical protein